MNKKKLPIAIQNIKECYNNRSMIVKLAKNDFKTRYAGSYFGILWAFASPIVTILMYWFVFSVGLRSTDVGNYPFVLWLTAGLVPWFYFSDALMGSSTSMMEYSFLVKKVVFNVSILPVIKIISALIINSIFYIIMIILFCCMGYLPTIYIVQLLYGLLCTTALVLAVSYFTSSVIVFFPDLRQIISIALQVGVWMTPIMWPISYIEGPFPWLVKLLKINPVYYIVQIVRDSMFGEHWFWERGWWSLYFWVLVLVLFVIGSRVFQKLKPHFADIL